MKRQTAQEIDQTAAAWAARVDRGLSSHEEAELDDWLAGDARRAGAYGRMRAIAIETERLAAAPVAPALSRRRLLGAGSALAASIAGGVGIALWARRSERFATRRGEVRQLVLEDGSVVTLNTTSWVETAFTSDRRELRLGEGEAYFDVASDAGRPFVVVAGATEARVVGTRFVVRRWPGEAVEVLVREGVVDVTTDKAVEGRAERLTAGMKAVATPMARIGGARGGDTGRPITVSTVSAADLDRALAWRDGRIAFEGETLAEAVIEFARYSDMRIIVEDPDLAREQIAGLYQTNDPVGFARAAAGSLRAEVRVVNGEVRLRKPSVRSPVAEIS